jgi:hypothetical protein
LVIQSGQSGFILQLTERLVLTQVAVIDLDKRRNQRSDRDKMKNRTAGGDGRRRVFTKLLKDENATLVNENQASRFLEGMETFDSKSELLAKLEDNRDEGSRRIREVLALINSAEGVEKLLIRFLKQVITEETSRPLFVTLRNKVLMQVYTVPALLDTLVQHTVATSMHTESATCLCLFLVAISKAFIEARNNQSVMEIARSLRERGDVDDARVLCALVLVEPQRELSNTNVGVKKKGTVVWITDEIPPGGRHDNDHLNFRNITIVPTADELCCETRPWLPFACGGNNFLDDPATRVISNSFRLLREDALLTMKERINENHQPWKNARIIDLDIAVYKGVVSFVVQCDRRGRGRQNWALSRSLAHGSVVAFCKDGIPKMMGTISVSDKEKEGSWLKAPGGPKIGVMIDVQGDDFKQALGFVVHNSAYSHHIDKLVVQYKDASKKKETARVASLATQINRYKSHLVSFDLIEVSSSFFTYQPILKSLQSMTTLPFLEEICENSSGGTGGHLDYLPSKVRMPHDKICHGSICDLQAWSIEDLVSKTSLDTSQARAIYHTFTNRVALIQGPPGTGKKGFGQF